MPPTILRMKVEHELTRKGSCLGTSLEVCFAETFLRNPPVRILALDDLAGRSIATVEVRRTLRRVPIHGPSLAMTIRIQNSLPPASKWASASPISRILWITPHLPEQGGRI
jgi:hypothetical protein